MKPDILEEIWNRTLGPVLADTSREIRYIDEGTPHSNKRAVWFDSLTDEEQRAAILEGKF